MPSPRPSPSWWRTPCTARCGQIPLSVPGGRIIATVAALVALYRPEELPAQLRRAVDNGVRPAELGAIITHIAFYAGFPAAISASAIAARTLLD